MTVTGASGTVEVRVSHSPVRIGKAGGSVTVFSSSGPVGITGVGGPAVPGGFSGGALSATHAISAGSADVEIDWPKAAGVAWRLESFGGDVIVLRPGEAPLGGATQGAQVHLEGRWKEGAARIEVASRGADIALDIR